MMNSVSAAHGAARLWGKKPNAEDLPHIRSVSDIAWSFWNRAAAAGNIQNINYLFVNLVMNDETNHLIELAHRGLSPPKSAPSGWPGTEFLMDSQGGQAILGKWETLENMRPTMLTLGRLSGGSMGRLLSHATQETAWRKQVHLQGSSLQVGELWSVPIHALLRRWSRHDRVRSCWPSRFGQVRGSAQIVEMVYVSSRLVPPSVNALR